ncbi:MAG: hypothetical protein IPK16_28135 [Anaerolineales bacterium]|nr:hypothetical protein [Anaerolineales bacterium]
MVCAISPEVANVTWGDDAGDDTKVLAHGASRVLPCHPFVLVQKGAQAGRARSHDAMLVSSAVACRLLVSPHGKACGLNGMPILRAIRADAASGGHRGN